MYFYCLQDDNKKWFSWLEDLFVFFSVSQFNHVFKEHRLYLLTKCKTSPFHFLGRFFTQQGSYSDFLLKCRLLYSSLLHLLQFNCLQCFRSNIYNFFGRKGAFDLLLLMIMFVHSYCLLVNLLFELTCLFNELKLSILFCRCSYCCSS